MTRKQLIDLLLTIGDDDTPIAQVELYNNQYYATPINDATILKPTDITDINNNFNVPVILLGFVPLVEYNDNGEF